MTETASLRALALVCSLEPAPAPASTTKTLAANAASLARLLTTAPYSAAG